MANTSSSLDIWREYFRTANSDIFDIIEHAIMVAASDCPYDFKMNRDRIAEMLFACKVTRCFGCDKIELAVPNGDGLEKSEDKYKSGVEAGGSKDTKESKVNSSNRDDDDDDVDDDDDHREGMEMNVNQVSNYSYGDAEALTDEIEEESQLYEEVLRIKEIVDNNEEESDSLLFDSLRKLQLMHLSVETLKATEIGKSVNALRKHGSKNIRDLARTLIEDWKVMVDSWVNATAVIAAGNATESVKTSVVEEEEGLPSPPLDEGAFFATTSMELSQFFDGIDDDGNPQNSGEFNKNRGSGRKPNLDKTDTSRNRKVESRDDSCRPLADRRAEEKRNAETMLKRQSPPSNKLNRPPTNVSGPGRPKPPSSESSPGRPKPQSSESGPGRPKPAIKPQVSNEFKLQQKSNMGTIQKKPMPPQQQKSNCNDEPSVRMKLEAAKRKLQERYQEAENAKKQRTIQVVELHDLPKQSLAPRNNHMRPCNHNRNWANGRR